MSEIERGPTWYTCSNRAVLLVAVVGIFAYGHQPSADVHAGQDGQIEVQAPETTENSMASRRAAARQLIAAALKDAPLISTVEDRWRAYSQIAEVQAMTGDIAAARDSVGSAKKAAMQLTTDYEKYLACIAMAEAQAAAGDVIDAHDSLKITTVRL